MNRDVVLAKVAIIQRCLERIQHVTQLDPERLDDLDVEDIFVLNLQRAVQAAIDLAGHSVVSHGYELPVTLREHFQVLEQHQLISSVVSTQMQKMCGFRNIAVHDYQSLAKPILQAILTDHLTDLEDFYSEIVALLPPFDS